MRDARKKRIDRQLEKLNEELNDPKTSERDKWVKKNIKTVLERERDVKG